jgi:hypothetical protein
MCFVSSRMTSAHANAQSPHLARIAIKRDSRLRNRLIRPQAVVLQHRGDVLQRLAISFLVRKPVVALLGEVEQPVEKGGQTLARATESR